MKPPLMEKFFKIKRITEENNVPCFKEFDGKYWKNEK